MSRSLSPKDVLQSLDNKVMRNDFTAVSMDRKKPIHKYTTQTHYKLVHFDPDSLTAHYKIIEYKNAVDSNKNANIGNHIVAKLKHGILHYDASTNSYTLSTASATGGHPITQKLIDPAKLIFTGAKAKPNPNGNTKSVVARPDSNPPPVSFEEGENLAHKKVNSK